MVKCVEDNTSSPLHGINLNEGEIGTELFLALCDRPSEQNVNLGQYIIKWKR